MKKEEFRNKFIGYMSEIEEYLSLYKYTICDEFHLCVILGNIGTCFKQCLIKEGIKNGIKNAGQRPGIFNFIFFKAWP